jgi:hypothetical protein
MASLSRVAITKLGQAGFGGCFLALPRLRLSLGFPARARADQFGVLARGANFPHGLAGRSPSSVGFSFHFTLGREATPDLLLPLKRRRFRRPSPHRRVAGPFRLWLRGSAYRPSDGGGLHRSWLGTIFSRRQHASPNWSAAGNPLNRLWGERFGLSSALRPRAVSGAPNRPKMPSPGVTLPGPFVTPPSPVIPVATRWLRTSAERCGVRARRSVRVRSRTGRLRQSVLSSFHCLTFSSKGKLSPEPLRLTQWVRERPG